MLLSSRFKQMKELEARQGEKLTAEGLCPGERLAVYFIDFSVLDIILAVCSFNVLIYSRFKQIKEQEARRRQQREEEKRKAAEAAAKGNQTTNEVHEREINVYERANGAGASSLDKNNGILQSVRGGDVSEAGVLMNGNTSGQEFKEDKDTTSVFKTEDSEVSANSDINGRDEKQSRENLEKVPLKSALNIQFACPLIGELRLGDA